LVFPAFSAQRKAGFVASCEAASLPRMLFGASLPRASEHHFLAKPALRPTEVGLASHLTNDWFFSLLS